MYPSRIPDHCVGGYRAWMASDSQLLSAWVYEISSETASRQTLLPHAETSLVACRRGDNMSIRIFGPARQTRSFDPDPATVFHAVTIAPEALPSLTGLHANDLVDQSACLELRHAEALLPVLDRMRDRNALDTLSIWARAVEDWSRGKRHRHDLTHRFAHYLRSRHGDVRIAELSSEFGLSDRQIRRNMLDAIGLTPKHYARQLRLQRLIGLADGQRHTRNWADLAYTAGYGDQSHLNRECRALTGLSPVALYNARHGMSEISKTLSEPV